MKKDIDDFIVIGSGFGGSIPAQKLVKAGYSVTLLERGPWRNSLPVKSMGISNRASYPHGWKLYSHVLRTFHAGYMPKKGMTVNKYGLFEAFHHKGLITACTSGVGGGSHAYSGLHQRATVPNFWDGYAEGLSDETMERHYVEVMGKFASRKKTPEDKVPNTTAELFGDSELFSDKNNHDEPANGIQFPETPGQPKIVNTEAGVQRWESSYDDDSFLGSPSGAKSSLDFIYLAEAIKDGLVVKDLCQVTSINRIENGEGTLYCIKVMDLANAIEREFHSRKVILAAGALNTNKLLFHSRDVAKGLTGMPQLGKNIGTNGDHGGYWALQDEGKDYSKGLPIHGPIGIKGEEDTYTITCGIPGLQHVPLPASMKTKLSQGVILAGMGQDACDGVASYKRGRLNIDYDASNSKIFDDINRCMDIAEQQSAKKIYRLPINFTVHTCGGAHLGSSIESGVINAQGEVFDNPGLYVTDGAALPASPGGPPSMPIAAWASHVAEGIISRGAAGKR